MIYLTVHASGPRRWCVTECTALGEHIRIITADFKNQDLAEAALLRALDYLTQNGDDAQEL